MSQKNGFSAHREDRIITPNTITVYYWHRIILVGLLLIFLVGGLGYWAFSQFDVAPPPVVPGSSAELTAEQMDIPERSHESAIAVEEPALDMPPTPPSAASFEPTPDDATAGTAATRATESTASEIDAAAIVDDAPVIDEDPEAAAAAIVDDAPVIDENSETHAAVHSPDDNRLDAAPAEPEPAADDSIDAPTLAGGLDHDSGKPTTTKIMSDAIARASLARGLLDKEPVGIYEHAVSLNGEDLITVFMFTQTRGYVGETIFHNWYLNDKRIAQVVIKPWTSPMRASSSKKIIPSMTGDWRVEVVDTTGRQLAVTTFEVVN